MPSLFWLPCRPPLSLFNGFSLSDCSLVSLWSSSSQPAWSAVSDIPSLTSSCQFVHPCLSASKYQTPHLSETSSGPLGQGRLCHQTRGPLPSQLSLNTHCVYGSLGPCQLFIVSCFICVSQTRLQSPLGLGPCLSLPEAQVWRTEWSHSLSCKYTHFPVQILIEHLLFSRNYSEHWECS